MEDFSNHLPSTMPDVTGNCSLQNPDEQEDPDEEEVLSLSDLPLNADENNDPRLNDRHLSPVSPHLFEFSTGDDLHSPAFPAEELLFGGKLIFLHKTCDRALPVQTKPQACIPKANNNVRRKILSAEMEIHKFRSNSNPMASQATGKKVTAKPRWHSPVQLPMEIEPNKVKGRPLLSNRSMKETEQNGNLVNRSSGKGSWKLIRILSCKNHASTM